MMIVNKLTVKNLVEFRRLSERSRSTFANNLKIPKKPKSDDSNGGNYWVRSISGLSNAFKHNDSRLVKEKIDLLAAVYESTENARTKIMYKRNLEILHSYEDFDFSIWRPSDHLKFLSKPKTVLTIKDIPIQIIPHHLFAYDNNGEPTIGGISFVIWLDGFKKGDLEIYSEALFKYISLLYSKKYKVNPHYCLIVDASSKDVVSYNQILEGKMPSLLQTTVEILNNYLH